jgi:hypothetical protein
MTIEQMNVIDMISLNASQGCVVLTVSDHLEWNSVVDHILLLQEKLNRYLAFVESGEILDVYPLALGRLIVIEVVFQYKPCPEAERFLGAVENIIQSSGIGFRWRRFPEQSLQS